MKIAVFGASGRTGRVLVDQALARGHRVTAFVRDPSRLPDARGRPDVVPDVVRGDVTDAAAVEEAVAGQDAVLSALGHAKGSPKDVQARGTANIIAAMEKHGVRRLISLTGAGVRAEGDEPKFVDGVFLFLLGVLQRDVLQDANRHVEEIQRSHLDWVVVRGPRLTEGEARESYRVGLVGKNSGTRISRADLAGFMLDQLTSDEHLRRMPVVSY